ncbi:hypothetical protein [Kocuria sp. CCUG 69068]|uniref:phage tail tube protein n=1 Tax=Kocuria sp. CCUG 69068 TaxID=2043138 RepID=UPI001E5A0A57
MANAVRVGAPAKSARTTGGLLSGPEGTPLPTDATTDLAPGLVGLGLIGNAGLAETPSRSTEEIRDWNGDIARTVQSEHGLTVTFTIIERTLQALREVHGQGNVTETVDGTTGDTLRVIKYNSEELPVRVYVAEMRDRGGVRIRKVYPLGQITEIAEIPHVKNGPIQYECTMTAYPDEDGNNEYEYELIPATTAPAPAA